MPKHVFVVCFIAINYLSVPTAWGEWFSPERTGRVTENGNEAFTCVTSRMTPREFIQGVRAGGGSYEVMNEMVDEDTGKVIFTIIKVKWPDQKATALMFFRTISACRFMVDSLSGMELDNLDRYE